MCMKWIKNAFKYEKILEEKENNKNHEKNKISIEQENNFKKWYLGEFKEELQHDCFKTLLESSG